MVTDELRLDVSIPIFCKWETFVIFGMQIVNLDTGSYLHQTSQKTLETAEKEKNDKYFYPCLKRSISFTPRV